MRIEPAHDIRHDQILAVIVEQVMRMFLVQLQRLVGGARLVMEELTAGGLCDLVIGAMEAETPAAQS